MRKTLTHKADGVAIQSDEDQQGMPAVSEGSHVELPTTGDASVITPTSHDERRRKFEQSMEEIDEKYAEVFRRLAKS